MSKASRFFVRFLKFTILFAVLYTILMLIFPYFRGSGTMSRWVLQIGITSILYGLLMAVLQPKVQVNKYTKKKDKGGEEE